VAACPKGGEVAQNVGTEMNRQMPLNTRLEQALLGPSIGDKIDNTQGLSVRQEQNLKSKLDELGSYCRSSYNLQTQRFADAQRYFSEKLIPVIYAPKNRYVRYVKKRAKTFANL
jgi:hypothetical protein